MKLAKVKRGCQITKGKKKSCRLRKGVSNSKNKTKKKRKIKLAPTIELDRNVHCVRVVAVVCAVLVASVRAVLVVAVGRRYRLRPVCSESRVGVGHHGWL